MKKLTRPAGRPGYRKLVYNQRFKICNRTYFILTAEQKKSEFLFSDSVLHGACLTSLNF